MQAGMSVGFLSAESEFARHASFAERKATIAIFYCNRFGSYIEKTGLETCPTSAKRLSSSSVGLRDWRGGTGVSPVLLWG
jgi:ABC-type ATPase with predicted acetyltransferase domain